LIIFNLYVINVISENVNLLQSIMQKIFIIVLLILISPFAQAHNESWDANKTEWSPLMLAVYNGETGRMMFLISQGADVNFATSGAQTHWKLTAMDVAIRKENETAVDKLLSTNRVSNPGKYLMTASGLKSAAIVELLIQRGASPNDTSESGETILMNAVSFGSDAIVEALLKHGANPNKARRSDGMTALMIGADNGAVEKVRVLTNYKANKDATDHNGHTAWYYAQHAYEHMDLPGRTMEYMETMLK
jgi:ankyrin repeat protein